MKNIEEKDMNIIIKRLGSLGYSVEYASGQLFDNNMFTLNIVGSYNQGTLTMLVNADGTPKLYEEDK